MVGKNDSLLLLIYTNGKIVGIQKIMEIDADVKDSSLILIKQGAEAVSSVLTLFLSHDIANVTGCDSLCLFDCSVSEGF